MGFSTAVIFVTAILALAVTAWGVFSKRRCRRGRPRRLGRGGCGGSSLLVCCR